MTMLVFPGALFFSETMRALYRDHTWELLKKI